MALALLLFVPPFLSRYYLHILVLIFLFAAAGESWNIIGGYGGQFSLGHAAFFGLGAYTSTMLFHYFEISPWLGMFLGALLSICLSWGIGWLCFRLQGPYFVIATIASVRGSPLSVLESTMADHGRYRPQHQIQGAQPLAVSIQ